MKGEEGGTGLGTGTFVMALSHDVRKLEQVSVLVLVFSNFKREGCGKSVVLSCFVAWEEVIQ